MNNTAKTHEQSLSESSWNKPILKLVPTYTEETNTFQLQSNYLPFDAPAIVSVALQHSAHHAAPIPAPGLLEVRQLLCPDSPEQIILAASIQQLFSAVLSAVTVESNPVWLTPKLTNNCFTKTLKRNSQNNIVIENNLDSRYKITATNLLAAIKRCGTLNKILILSNPTHYAGQLYSDRELEILSTVCRRHKVLVLVDESNFNYAFEGNTSKSFANYYPEGTLSLTDCGKLLAAPGYQMAYLKLPKELLKLSDSIIDHLEENSFHVSSPIQYAAIKALAKIEIIDEHVKNITRIMQACTYYAYRRLSDMRLTNLRPESGCSVLIDFSIYRDALIERGIFSSEDLVSYLLKHYSIAVTPGEKLGLPGEALIARISCVDFNTYTALEASKEQKWLDIRFVEKYCSRIVRGLDTLEAFISACQK